jgi:putative acetyltransferase
MTSTIIPGDLGDPRVLKLLEIHLTAARANSPPASAHALDVAGLQAADVAFWTMWEEETLLSVGALRRLSAGHGEIKSMHTAEAVRGRGHGGAMLRHNIATARAEGLSHLSLETGSWDYFHAARALYARHGFVVCEPFGHYVPDPNSVFMTLAL